MFTVQKNHELFMEWQFPYRPEMDVDEAASFLKIKTESGIELFEVRGDAQLNIDRVMADIVTVTGHVYALNYTEGKHLYEVFVVDTSGTVLLQQTGFVTVVAQTTEAPEVADVRLRSAWRRTVRDSEQAQPGVADERMAMCLDCPFYRTDGQLCVECGCYMPLKTTLMLATCPKDRWVR